MYADKDGPQYDTEFLLYLPARIVDLHYEGGYDDAGLNFDYIVEVVQGFPEPHTPNFSNTDIGPFRIYVGDDIYGRKVD
ncbi:MAG: hypothetical protein IKD69_07230, partial [Solobacterium sp.]|nr:hypothetical protein [Solobacterium sp.]